MSGDVVGARGAASVLTDSELDGDVVADAVRHDGVFERQHRTADAPSRLLNLFCRAVNLDRLAEGGSDSADDSVKGLTAARQACRAAHLDQVFGPPYGRVERVEAEGGAPLAAAWQLDVQNEGFIGCHIIERVLLDAFRQSRLNFSVTHADLEMLDELDAIDRAIACGLRAVCIALLDRAGWVGFRAAVVRLTE